MVLVVGSLIELHPVHGAGELADGRCVVAADVAGFVVGEEERLSGVDGSAAHRGTIEEPDGLAAFAESRPCVVKLNSYLVMTRVDQIANGDTVTARTGPSPSFGYAQRSSLPIANVPPTSVTICPATSNGAVADTGRSDRSPTEGDVGRPGAQHLLVTDADPRPQRTADAGPAGKTDSNVTDAPSTM